MKTQEVALSQEEMENSLHDFLIKSYIANGSIKVTPLSIEENLNFSIKKETLDYEIMLMSSGLIENEIHAQSELDSQNDFLKFYNKVSKKITTFDFSKYENMSIEELRSYLFVWDENAKYEIVRGKKLIKGKVKRACVGIYSLLKGGTCIYANSDSEDSENKILEGNIDNMLERITEMSVNNELSEENRAKLLKVLV
jgi:hypothetical protein